MSQTISVEEIKASTGIEQSIKRRLDALEEQDLRPAALTKWARDVFSEARKLNHKDEETAEWVIAYARAGHYSDSQISSVLTLNNVRRENRFNGGGSGGSGIGNWYNKFKTITLDATGADETDIIRADYSPTKIIKLAEDNLRDWTYRMTEADLKTNLRWLKITEAILGRGSELIEQRMKQSRITT
jgi:hypothetical protein